MPTIALTRPAMVDGAASMTTAIPDARAAALVMGPIDAAFTTGERPDGRILVPSMPWRGYAHLTKSDAMAIAAFLKSLPPVSHKVPGPVAPGEPLTGFVLSVQPAEVYSGLPQPPPR